MVSHHAWDASMCRLDGILERCLRQYEIMHERAVQAL
jgi:hypothetical protein